VKTAQLEVAVLWQVGKTLQTGWGCH